jgi:hypothetical protein
LNVAPRDQRGAAGECESFRLVEAGDDLCDPLLKRTEHLLTAKTRDPVRPSLTNCGRQNELVPEIDQPLGVDVLPNVALGSLAHGLLVNAGSIGPLVEVVGQRRAAPADVGGSIWPLAFGIEEPRSSGTATGRAAGPSSRLRTRAIASQSPEAANPIGMRLRAQPRRTERTVETHRRSPP